MGIPYFTYEQLCASPASCIDAVVQICPELSGIDVHASIAVKDYKRQGLVNQNRRQIELLADDDLSIISEIVGRENELLHFFDYHIM